MESREAGAGEDRSKSQGERIVGGAIEMEEPGAKATPSLLLAHREAVQFNYVRMVSPESAKLNPDPYFAEVSLFAFVRSSSRVGLRPGLICRASAKSCSASSVFFKRIRARPR